MFHNKIKIASEEEKNTESAYTNEVFARNAQQQSLAVLEKRTKGSRDYLKEWEPHLKSVRDAQFGEALINLRIKQGNMVTLSSQFESMNFDKGGTIPRRLQGRLVFEDDFVKTLNWLADFEGAMPASRISSCRISKGQAGNDIKAELTIDVPILDAGEKKKA
jgi:hypothetical protein